MFKLFKLVIILFPLVICLALSSFVKADPYIYRGQVPPDSETFPSVITILPLTNNTAFRTNSLQLNFNISAPESRTAASTAIYKVSYSVDWVKKPIVLYYRWADPGPGVTNLAFSLEFHNISEGKHDVLIEAIGSGWYIKQETSRDFQIASSCLFCFTIDTIAPTVSIIPTQNATYESSDVPLTICTSEPISNASYVLDGQETCFYENITLTNLPDGVHNITAYAWDSSGNMGSSKTVHFSVKVPVPFPMATFVAASSGVSIAIVTAALIYHFRRRSH